MAIIDDIIKELRENHFSTNTLYVSKNIYDKIEEETQEINFDYNSPVIEALKKISLIIDMDLKEDEYKLEK